MDVINPRTASLTFRLRRSQQQQLLPAGGACVPTTAVGLIPLSLLLQHAGNQFLSDEPPETAGGGVNNGVAALVGSADGTLALWPTGRASCQPWNVILAHTDAVVAIRTAMDAPQDALERLSGIKATPTGRNSPRGAVNGDGDSYFFVVTAGGNREVKVWGIDTAERQDIPPLTLAGYTVVGSGGSGDGGDGGSGRLTALELLSEGHMACGFESGTVEVWSIPFTSRSGVLASTREAVQAFPLVHGAKVTSIVVSLGIGFHPRGGGGMKAGRVVLTTSADRTIIRWVSMAPGDNIRPVNRYCLSQEPAAAVLLPPPVAVTPPSTTNGRHAWVHFPRKQPTSVDIEIGDSTAAAAAATEGSATASTKASTMFRVVAALNGVVTVVDVATVEALIGEGSVCGADQPRKLCPAVANAFPGTPLVPRLPPRASSYGSHSEQSGARESGSSRWKVGGPRGREAGQYDILGGIEGNLLGWDASGRRRLVQTAAARKAWLAHRPRGDDGGGGGGGAGAGAGGGGDNEECRALSPTSANRPQSSKRTRRKRSKGEHPSRRRPATVKPSVKLLTVCPVQRSGKRGAKSIGVAADHDRGVQTAPEHAYRKVNGGKTIKMDPRFAAAAAAVAAAAAEDRLLVQRHLDGDSSVDHSLSPAGGGHDHQADQRGAGVCSMQFAVPNLSGWKSTAPPKGGESELSAVAVSFLEMSTASLNDSDYYSSRFHHSPTPPPLSFTGEQHPSGGSSASGGGNSVSCGDPDHVSLSMHSDEPASSARAGTDRGARDGNGDDDDDNDDDNGDDGDNDEDTHTNKKTKAGPMNAVVAANSAARRARDAWDAWGRTKPTVLERRRTPFAQEPRLQFNFDSAQAPSVGMSGVGVAVPRGYADER